MMAKILFLNEAIEDIRKARNWYDEKEDGLGHFFINRIDESINEIQNAPKAYPVKYGFLRAKMVRSFPYSIFYSVKNHGVIRIYACIHHKQLFDNILESR